MFQADRIGLGVVHDTLRRLTEAHGDLFAPSPLLARLAGEGKAFGDL